jgi:two-component system, LuxR family, secretion system response regulator SsrB
MDEPQGLSPTFRATLEHMPSLRTIDEADLARTDTDNAVALVFVDETRIADSIARVSALKDRLPNLRTLVAFQALTAGDLRELMAAGADAFVARAATPREVCTAVLALAEGMGRLVEGEAAAAQPEASDGLGLTPREAEVLRFLSAGFSNKEVARRLALSVRTVETHRLNLRRKTQTGRLKDLVSLARQLGLAPVVDADMPRRPGGPSRH